MLLDDLFHEQNHLGRCNPFEKFLERRSLANIEHIPVADIGEHLFILVKKSNAFAFHDSTTFDCVFLNKPVTALARLIRILSPQPSHVPTRYILPSSKIVM